VARADVSTAVAALRAGGPVVLHGDRGELAGDHHLLLAAELATPHEVAFMVRHTSGFLRAILTQADADRLGLPLMYSSTHRTSYAVAVDASDNVTTGISATDRATTLRTLADPDTVAAQLRRPGHVIPVRANDQGLIGRPGYAEAVVDLMRIAGLRPAGALSELVGEDGTPVTVGQRDEFCRTYEMPVVSVAAVLEHRLDRESFVERTHESNLVVAGTPLRLVGFRSRLGGHTHLAVCVGRPDPDEALPLHIVRSGSPAIDAAGPDSAVVVYLNPAEGSESDCAATLHAGTLESMLVEQILVDLGVRQVRQTTEIGTLLATHPWTRVTPLATGLRCSA
jgi:3,4-dihydroxy 2-butanone 4-phosphate synthase/GTP cyclohydrolase II